MSQKKPGCQHHFSNTKLAQLWGYEGWSVHSSIPKFHFNTKLIPLYLGSSGERTSHWTRLHEINVYTCFVLVIEKMPSNQGKGHGSAFFIECSPLSGGLHAFSVPKFGRMVVAHLRHTSWWHPEGWATPGATIRLPRPRLRGAASGDRARPVCQRWPSWWTRAVSDHFLRCLSYHWTETIRPVKSEGPGWKASALRQSIIASFWISDINRFTERRQCSSSLPLSVFLSLSLCLSFIANSQELWGGAGVMGKKTHPTNHKVC